MPRVRERVAYWDTNFNTHSTHCGTTFRDGKCDHQARAMQPPQIAATNAHGKHTHTVAQLKLPSAAAEELTTTAGDDASAQEVIMRETSVRMLITPGDSEHTVEISGCDDNVRQACAQARKNVSIYFETQFFPRICGAERFKIVQDNLTL